MSKGTHTDNRGAALVVTLGVIAVLLVIAAKVSLMATQSAYKSQEGMERFLAEQRALSGIHLAAAILCEDASRTEIDSVQEDWADPVYIEERIVQLGIKPSELDIRITDEMSKVQINALIESYPGSTIRPGQVRIWEHFFTIMTAGAETEEPVDLMALVNCVKDWLDSEDDDAVTGISGAESEYYMTLEHPYSPANGPFNHLSELFLVKGFSRQWFNSFDLKLADLEKLLTVYGLEDKKLENRGWAYSGQININTAPVEVLSAILPEGMEDFAPDLVEFRLQKGEQNIEFLNSLDKGWYKRVIDLPGKELKRFEERITYQSNLFRVESAAVQKSHKVRLVAFMVREKQAETGKWHCRVIQMERKE